MSKVIRCGEVLIGGGNPISIQSMTNVDTKDVSAAVSQIYSLVSAGCDIVRLAVPDLAAATAFGEIKKQSPIPMVADIHFDFRLAVEAIKQGADKIRINPGNIGSKDNIKAVVDAAKERDIPIRIGVNSGSLEKEIIMKNGGVTAEGIVESALRNIRILEDMEFGNIMVSIKSADVKMNHAAHKLIATKIDYPIHIGLTEAGTMKLGCIKSAIGLGALLLEGIGDTMRVSLTGDPVNEVILAKNILKILNLRNTGINLISCPTCGRTKVNLEKIAGEIEQALVPIEAVREKEKLPKLTIAVMGCAVNGPGEAAEADLGVACGDGKGVLFSKGKILKVVDEQTISEEIIKMVKEYKG